MGRPDADGLVRSFNGTGFGEGGLERPTLQLGSAVQIIAIPHTRTVAVVDLGPVMHRVDTTGTEKDWAHNLFREGVDEYAQSFTPSISRDEAARRLIELGLASLHLPSDTWLEANR
ncbi:MAG: hypothetical protein AB1925_12725 [Actinomycetota bacterium]